MTTGTVNRTYPRAANCGGAEIELRWLAPADEAALLAFAQRLSAHDLLFLPRDVSQPKVVAAWVQASRSDAMVTLVATGGGLLLGCATLVRDPWSWARHVGELRVIVDPSMRGKGLGQALTQECFAIALELGLEKLTAQMTVDQRGAIAVFQGLGFRPEALLARQVKDRGGQAHDIVVLSHDVAAFESQRQAYGVDEAF